MDNGIKQMQRVQARLDLISLQASGILVNASTFIFFQKETYS